MTPKYRVPLFSYFVFYLQFDEVTYEPGVITLYSNGVKRTILYNTKDCYGKYIPKQGDKVIHFKKIVDK